MDHPSALQPSFIGKEPLYLQWVAEAKQSWQDDGSMNLQKVSVKYLGS